MHVDWLTLGNHTQDTTHLDLHSDAMPSAAAHPLGLTRSHPRIDLATTGYHVPSHLHIPVSHLLTPTASYFLMLTGASHTLPCRQPLAEVSQTPVTHHTQRSSVVYADGTFAHLKGS